MSGYIIYRYIFKDKTIYVGKTKNDLKLRIYAHAQESKFFPYLNGCKIEYFDVENHPTMDIYEKYLINKMSPILNVSDKYNAHFAFSLPYIEWIPYESYVCSTTKLDEDSLISKKHRKNMNSLQRSIKTYKKNLEKYEERVNELTSLLSFIAWNHFEDFNTNTSGIVHFDHYGQLPKHIYATINGERKQIPVFIECVDKQSNRKSFSKKTYTSKIDDLEKVYKYGLQNLSWELSHEIGNMLRTKDIIHDKELEKTSLRYNIIS